MKLYGNNYGGKRGCLNITQLKIHTQEFILSQWSVMTEQTTRPVIPYYISQQGCLSSYCATSWFFFFISSTGQPQAKLAAHFYPSPLPDFLPHLYYPDSSSPQGNILILFNTVNPHPHTASHPSPLAFTGQFSRKRWHQAKVKCFPSKEKHDKKDFQENTGLPTQIMIWHQVNFPPHNLYSTIPWVENQPTRHPTTKEVEEAYTQIQSCQNPIPRMLQTEPPPQHRLVFWIIPVHLFFSSFSEPLHSKSASVLSIDSSRISQSVTPRSHPLPVEDTVAILPFILFSVFFSLLIIFELFIEKKTKLSRRATNKTVSCWGTSRKSSSPKQTGCKSSI
ncbi:hypothetical protein VP01_3347g1 [Puccinia sorghi]|uniref:Uncharacterized protein n=1 Tax=Puccinia sorghi TaxID=27349 RepID=A0A0L6UYY5_9BASI|nr:hypothetical protein VP01_3347g1 [Puccinia sorghi]